MAATALGSGTATIELSGADLTFENVDGTNGNKFRNNPGRTFLIVRNAAGSPITVTIAAKKLNRPPDGQYPASTVPNISGTVAAGGFKMFGPFRTAYQDAEGYVEASFSSGTSVTAEVVDAGVL
jgi:hypothetical protein